MADNRKPMKDPDVFSDSKMKLYAKPLQDGARSPSLRVKMIENNPCIDVDLGIKSEGRNGKEGYPIRIETPMEPKSFRILMNLIQRVAAYPNPCSFEMENEGYPFIYDRDKGGNIRSPDKLVISRFSISKRDDGMVTFGVTAKGKKDIEFEFMPNDFHAIMQNGSRVDVRLSSQMSAQAWAENWIDIYVQHYESKWTEPEFQRKRRMENMQRSQNGGGGGYNQQQNRPSQNNQQHSQPQQSTNSAPASTGNDNGFEEDIPF